MGAASLAAVLSLADGAELFARRRLEAEGLQAVMAAARTTDSIDGLRVPRAHVVRFTTADADTVSAAAGPAVAVRLVARGLVRWRDTPTGRERAARAQGVILAGAASPRVAHRRPPPRAGRLRRVACGRLHRGGADAVSRATGRCGSAHGAHRRARAAHRRRAGAGRRARRAARRDADARLRAAAGSGRRATASAPPSRASRSGRSADAHGRALGAGPPRRRRHRDRDRPPAAPYRRAGHPRSSSCSRARSRRLPCWSAASAS